MTAFLLLLGCTAGPAGRPSAPTPSVSGGPPSASASTPSAPSAAPGSPSPTGAATASASPTRAAIASVEDAIAAVAAVEPRFQGFGPLDPGVIGQANHVRGSETARGFELTFVAGSGDCPAGCINHHYTKFLVGRDGSVVMLCEWAEGEAPQGTPC